VAEFLKLAWRRAAPHLEWALRIKWRYLFPAFSLSLYLAMVAVDRITRINLMSGVCDSESDSIDIAIFGLESILAEPFSLTVLGIGSVGVQPLCRKTKFAINLNRLHRYIRNLSIPSTVWANGLDR
jgi:hypothetical protein